MCVSCSVLFSSLQPHGPQPAGLLCPWNSPGKNTGVGSHSIYQHEIKSLKKDKVANLSEITKWKSKWSLRSIWNGTYASVAKSLQSCLTLCDPMDRCPPGSSVRGILQARTIVPTQASYLHLSCPLWQAAFLPLVPPGRPLKARKRISESHGPFTPY